MNLAAYADEKLGRVIKLTDRTKETYKRHIRGYLDYIESMRNGQHTLEDVSAAAEEYFRHLAYDEYIGVSTQKQIHAALKHLNQFLAEDYGIEDFTSRILVTDIGTFHASAGDLKMSSFLQNAREGHVRDALVVSLLANSGMSPAQIVALKTSDIKESDGCRYIITSDRAIPIGTKLQEDFERALMLVTTDEIFMGKKGVLSVNGIGHILKKVELREGDGPQRFTYKSLHANFKYRLLESGYPREWCEFAYRYVSGLSLESVRHFEQPYSWLQEVMQKIEL